MVKIASRYARSDRIKDDLDNEDRGKSQSDAPKNKKRKHEDRGSSLVAAVSKDSGKKKSKKGKGEYVKSEYTCEVAEGQPCKIHSTATK